MCRSLVFNKFAGGAYNFIEKETVTVVFSNEFCDFFQKTFFKEHLRTTASVCRKKYPLKKLRIKILYRCMPDSERYQNDMFDKVKN